MTFISKLCILAVVASVNASPKISRTEGEAGNVWSKFLGKVPEYFKENSELETSNQAEAGAHSEAQNDEIANDGGSSYPNPSQLTENKWQDKFKECMESSFGQTSSSGSSTDSSNQYGTNQMSNFNSESFNKYMEKCRAEVTSSMGQYPGLNGGQDFFSNYRPQFPSNFGSYTSALTGSSPSSGSSASA